MDTVALYRGTRIVWYVAYALEILLFTRFALLLLGANPGAAFSNLVYSLSAIPLAPFRYVFGADEVVTGVFEWSTLLAMLVYWCIAWGVVKLMLMGRHVSETDAAQTLSREELR